MTCKKISREQELTEKRRYWKRHIQSWRSSGLTGVSEIIPVIWPKANIGGPLCHPQT